MRGRTGHERVSVCKARDARGERSAAEELVQLVARAQVRRAVDLSRAAGAQVLLIAVPRPTLSAAFTGSLTDHKLFGEIAESMQLPLHRQGWSEVLADEQLKADAIHANAQGYAQFARGLKATAQAVGLLPR